MDKEKVNTLSNSRVDQILGKNSFLKISVLVFFALIFSYTPLAVFAPIPIAMSILLAGKKKTFMVSLAVLAGLAFSASKGAGLILTFTFFITNLYAFLISDIITSKTAPMKGLFRKGLYLFGGVLLLVGFVEYESPNGIRELLTSNVVATFDKFKSDNQKVLSSGTEDAKELLKVMSNPDAIVDQVIKWGGSYLFIFINITLWIGLSFVLRNAPFWRSQVNYQYGYKDLLRFKMPYFSAWLLILAMALYLLGDVFGPELEVVGGNLLYCLGVFYFFSGYGVFIDFLTHLKIFGIMRMLMIVSAWVIAWRVIVIVGILDLWINFRKFFKKKNEGDIQ